jgi:imidazolonepropionase-like amidohydrolase
MMSSRLLLTAGKLDDPAGAAITDCAVVVEGELIWAGADVDLLAEFAGIERRDLGAVTLLPGLVDAHVHRSLGSEPTVVGDRVGVPPDNEELATCSRAPVSSPRLA